MRRRRFLVTCVAALALPALPSGATAGPPERVALVANSTKVPAPLPEHLARAQDGALTVTAHHAADLGYAWVDRAHGEVVVDAATPAGEATARAVVARLAKDGVPARVRLVRFSRTRLDSIKDDAIYLRSSDVPDGDLIVQTQPDAEHDRVLVTIERYSAALVRALARRYGAAAIAVRVRPGRDRLQAGGRGAEVNPYWGGAWVNVGSTLCTSGFSWLVPGTQAMLTAGHCAPDGGTLMAGTENIGSITDARENWNVDTGTEAGNGDFALAYITPGKKAGDLMYRGDAAGVHGYPVRELWSRRAAVGDQYCTGGRVTGELCGWSVTATGVNHRYMPTIFDFNGPVILNSVEGSKLGYCTQQGDSGGPVYTVRSDNGIAAKGITSGGGGGLTDHYGGSIDPCKHWFSDLYDAVALFGGSVLTKGNARGNTLSWVSSSPYAGSLFAEDYLASTDGRFVAKMQADGNFVLYKPGGVAVWATGTNSASNAGTKLVMQQDGNLVLYRPGSGTTTVPIWSTNTYTSPGAYLVLQNDCNLVLYLGTRAIWSSGTYLCA